MMVTGLKTACSSQVLNCYNSDRSHTLVLFLLPEKKPNLQKHPFKNEQHFSLLTSQCDTLRMYICECSVSLNTQAFFCSGATISSAINHSWLNVPGVFYCSSFLKEGFLSCFSKVFCCLHEMRNFYTNHSQQDCVSCTCHTRFCAWKHQICLGQAYQLTLANCIVL